MSSTAAIINGYAPEPFRFKIGIDGLPRLCVFLAAGVAAAGFLAAAVATVGTLGETVSLVHSVSYDTDLAVKPLSSTLPPPRRPDRFERIAGLQTGSDARGALTAEAVLKAHERQANAAFAAGMQRSIAAMAQVAAAHLVPATAAVVSALASRSDAAPDETGTNEATLALALRHDPAGSPETARPAQDLRMAEVDRPPPRPVARPFMPKVAAPVKPAKPLPQVAETGDEPAPQRLAPPKTALNPPAAREEAKTQTALALPRRGSGVAVYDLSAGVVYMPNGERLEAHSGMGQMRDNIRFVHVKMRGATPPGTYHLTYREALFHGVQALRLTPVDGRAPLGRTGLLAHTYMLRVPGDSNGCVVFRDYGRFLAAFKRGEIRQMVVVPSVSASQRVASLF